MVLLKRFIQDILPGRYIGNIFFEPGQGCKLYEVFPVCACPDVMPTPPPKEAPLPDISPPVIVRCDCHKSMPPPNPPVQLFEIDPPESVTEDAVRVLPVSVLSGL